MGKGRIDETFLQPYAGFFLWERVFPQERAGLVKLSEGVGRFSQAFSGRVQDWYNILWKMVGLVKMSTREPGLLKPSGEE